MVKSAGMKIGETLRRYYYLTKPGIIYGNSLSAAAGFLLAAQGDIDWLLFAATLAGTSLVIASACVFNNYIDRGIDRKMARTSRRALVTGKINGRAALLYATMLSAAGFSMLVLFTNPLVVIAGLIGLVSYVVVYGAAKRRSTWGTVIGSIPGAMPITAGYLAVSGDLDMCAWLLFLAMACWQMPHFYAIAMYRLKDYESAGLPVLPVQRGARRTKIEITAYIAAFALVCAWLTLVGCTGLVFIAGMLAINLFWFWRGVAGFKASDDTKWAKLMFRISLQVLLLFSLLLAFDWLLP